ncbi:aminotransferase [Synergistales bacterium]|nr:aminotransferase [Synergistales bacterium]
MLDRDLVEREYGYLGEDIYLNIASVAMPPARVRDVCRNFLDDYVSTFCRKIFDDFGSMRRRAGEKLSKLINAAPEEITFVKNTTEGNSILACGYELAVGGNVVVCDLEHPSNLFPWINAQRRGIKVKSIATRHGEIPAESVIAAMDGDTRVVALSAVQYGTGYFSDLKMIGEACRRRKVVFAVDAIQGLGRLKIDVNEFCIDYLSCGGFKGLLGTLGAGFVYCDSGLIRSIVPPYAGYQSTTGHAEPPAVTRDFENLPWHDDVRRLEAGGQNTYGIMAMDKGVELILELGIDEIESHIRGLEAYMRERITDLPRLKILRPADPARWSGIVCVLFPEHAFDAARGIMEKHKIHATLRKGYLRLSIGFYNSREQMEIVTQALMELSVRCN